MIIRQERITDYDEVYELVKTSFAAAASPPSDGTEADYLNDVRKKDTFIPELSLVAESDSGAIVGQIVLYKTEITKTEIAKTEIAKTEITASDKTMTELVLSPICVHPDYFRQGIGRALMEKAFEIAKALGYTAVLLCGDPEFYRKIGFRPTYEYGIYHVIDEDKSAEWCMVRELTDGALLNISGTVDIQ